MNTTSIAVNRTSSRPSTLWKTTLILIPFVTLGLLLWLRYIEVNALRQRAVSSYGTVPSFQLVNQNGQPFGSAQLAGKIWIADFIYTTCPGPCPMISSRMSELQKPLEKTDVHLVHSASIRRKIRPRCCAVTRISCKRILRAGISLRDQRARFTNSRTMVLNLPSRTAAANRAFRFTARGWCWWIGTAISAATTTQLKRTR